MKGGLKPVLLAAAAALFVAMLGGTITDLGPWYRALQQPSWAPPDWLFPVAWTTIYALTALAGVMAWRNAPRGGPQALVIGAFAGNGFLNVLWSLIFFRLKRPDWALAELILLWLSIVVLIVVGRRYSRTAGWLLLPYLGWVTVAGALNAAVVRLNGPFQ